MRFCVVDCTDCTGVELGNPREMPNVFSPAAAGGRRITRMIYEGGEPGGSAIDSWHAPLPVELFPAFTSGAVYAKFTSLGQT